MIPVPLRWRRAMRPRPTPATRIPRPPAGWPRLFQDLDRAPDLIVIHTPRPSLAGTRRPSSVSTDRWTPDSPELRCCCPAPASPRAACSPRSSRVIAVAATMAHACGVPFPGIDGEPLIGCGGSGRPRRGRPVVGRRQLQRPAGDLTDEGQLPAVGRLLEHGCAFAGGAARRVSQCHPDESRHRVLTGVRRQVGTAS